MMKYAFTFYNLFLVTTYPHAKMVSSRIGLQTKSIKQNIRSKNRIINLKEVSYSYV